MDLFLIGGSFVSVGGDLYVTTNMLMNEVVSSLCFVEKYFVIFTERYIHLLLFVTYQFGVVGG